MKFIIKLLCLFAICLTANAEKTRLGGGEEVVSVMEKKDRFYFPKEKLEVKWLVIEKKDHYLIVHSHKGAISPVTITPDDKGVIVEFSKGDSKCLFILENIRLGDRAIVVEACSTADFDTLATKIKQK